MTIRNLEHLFDPRAIAIVSHGNQNDDPAPVLQQNLINAGFEGPVMPVNPDRRAVSGVLTFKNIAALPAIPDLAIITASLPRCPPLVDALGAKGARAVSIISHQPSRLRQPQWAELKQALLDAAKPHLLRILGPDRLGFAVPGKRIVANGNRTPLRAGHIAVITHSSAMMHAIVNWAGQRRIGFSYLVSLGARLDIDESDLLDYLTYDYNTRAILLHLEQVEHPRKFMSAARAAARVKPVIVLKPRNFLDPVEDAIYDAAFRRAGIACVDTINHLFTTVESLVDAKKTVNGNHLTILGNSRHMGLLAADALLRLGGALASVSDAGRKHLTETVATAYRTANPVDLGDNADPEAYRQALKILLQEPAADALLIVHTPKAGAADQETARAIVETVANSQRPVLANWVGLADAAPVRQIFREAGIPSFGTPEEAARAFVGAAEYERNQALLMDVPASIPDAFTADMTTARRLLDTALKAGRNHLNPREVQRLLAAYEIPVVSTHYAQNPRDAACQAAALQGPVALKILSPDIADRSDVGGLALALYTPDEVAGTAAAMLERLRRSMPQAVIEGFIVQPMLSRHGAYELTIGMRSSPQFGDGPVLLFGQGGPETQVIDDVAYGIPPLNMHLASEMMSRTRIHKRLTNSSDRPVNLDALTMTLIKVSQMIVDLAQITALDINPLWAGAEGVLILDAQVWIAEATKPAGARLAIHPYPKELEQTIRAPDGRNFQLRPILPEDAPPLRAFVSRMPKEDRRLRFFQPISELSPEMAARLTQLDYDREMALVVTDPGLAGQADIRGVVRMHADPDLERAEYAIAVDRAMTGLGLGTWLMRLIIDYARGRGIGSLYGEVLKENERMLKLNQTLGFNMKRDPDDPGMMHVSLTL